MIELTGYHKVILKRQKYRAGKGPSYFCFQDFGSSFEVNGQMYGREWIEEHEGACRWGVANTYDGKAVFYFKHDADAVMFALKFSEAME